MSLAIMVEQQKATKENDYQSLVKYSMTLSAQTSFCALLMSAFCLCQLNKVMGCLLAVLVSLVLDGSLKLYYFQIFRKSAKPETPSYHRQRKRMWMEGISFLKDMICLISVVVYSHQALVIGSQLSAAYFETCYLVASMVLLLYFVISAYFMISQSFCYHYTVGCLYLVHINEPSTAIFPSFHVETG